MQIVHKNEGAKIDYVINDEHLTLGNEITINLAEYERDFPVHLDICSKDNGSLTLGLGEKYIAQIDIPHRQYIYPKPNDNEEEEPSKVALPFDIQKATLTLWGMED